MIVVECISLIGLLTVFGVTAFLLLLYFKKINRQSDRLFEERLNNLEQAIYKHRMSRADRYKLLNTYDFLRYNLGEVLIPKS